jgi:hypothetical protein
MKPVTVQEVIDALRSERFMINTRNTLATRIESEGIAPPDGYVLVPIEPTAEMISAAEEAYMPFGDMGMALICGNLAAPKQENTNE